MVPNPSASVTLNLKAKRAVVPALILCGETAATKLTCGALLIVTESVVVDEVAAPVITFQKPAEESCVKGTAIKNIVTRRIAKRKV